MRDDDAAAAVRDPQGKNGPEDPRQADQDVDDTPGADDEFNFDHRAVYGTDKNDHANDDQMGINDPNLSSKRSDSTVGNMDKYSVDVALNSLGVCLDGSTPVYWMREGTGDSSDKWLIHLKGGGWCTTDEECAGWVNKGFQSGTGEQSGGDGDGSITFNSDQLPNNITGVGIMSIDPSINPVFFDWNVVYLWYCDGSSYTGYRNESVMYTNDDGNETELFYRGSHVVDSLAASLNKHHQMKSATDVVLTGSSAGGLGAIHSCDRFAGLIQSKNFAFRCIPDAAFFFNADDFSGAKGRWATKWEDMVETHSSETVLNNDCLDGQEDEYKWKCVLADHALKYVNTSTFLIQSSLDVWQLEYNYFSTDLDESMTQAGHDCLFSPLRKCTSATFAGIQDFREQLLTSVKAVAKYNDQLSFFVDACFKHTQTDRNKPFLVPIVDHQTISMSIHRWMHEGAYYAADDSTGVVQTRTLDDEAWPHEGQSCDWGPQWEQFVGSNYANTLSNEDYVANYLLD